MDNNTKNLIFLRPMMNISELVPYLKQKNIKFDLISEEDAEAYLKYNNNYYNVTAYKHNFQKYPSPAGKYEGLYQDLDFAYLKDMAIIDHRTRLLLFKMIIDIEHYLKIKILNTIETIEEEDEYKIVNLYLEKDFNDEKFPKRVHNSIFKKVGNEYYQKIFSKYDVDKDKKLENIPIWEFLEIITFGELVNFYDFYTKEYNLLDENRDVYILRDIVKLRNAVAHNTCVLSELNKKDNDYPASYKIVQYLKDCNIGKKFKFRFFTKILLNILRIKIKFIKLTNLSNFLYDKIEHFKMPFQLIISYLDYSFNSSCLYLSRCSIF